MRQLDPDDALGEGSDDVLTENADNASESALPTELIGKRVAKITAVDGEEGQTIRVGTIDEEKMARGCERGGPMRQQFYVSFDDGGEKKMSWKEALKAISDPHLRNDG